MPPKLSRGSLLFLAAALVLAGAGLSLSRRLAVEAGNRTVALAAESDAVAALAAGSRVSFPAALARLKRAGITALSVGEETLGEAIAEGRAELRVLPDGPTVRVPDPVLRERVVTAASIRFGEGPIFSGDTLRFPGADASLLRSMSLLLPPETTSAARDAGMIVIARGGNPTGIGDEGIRATVRAFAEEGARVFLPQGDTTLGRRAGTPAAVAALRGSGMLYASPEFAKIGGDLEMLNLMPERSVRLHSAQTAELDKLSPEGIVDRYVKAATERDVRILLLRPAGVGGASPLEAFAATAEEIVRGIGRSGFVAGPARPFDEPAPPALARILVGIGIALAAIATPLLMGSGRLGLGGGIAAAVVAAAGAATGKGLEPIALLAALVFPFGGMLVALEGRWRWPVAVLVATGLSVAGGLAAASLLNATAYMIRAQQFSGVKAAVFLPVAAVGAWAFSRYADLRGSLRSPITWGAAGLGVLVLAILGILIVRSGNDAPAGVSGGELAFRGLLEEYLPVRPRTKEFLIGFPALVVGFAWLAKAGYEPRRLGSAAGWVALLLMLGTIALTDVVNTLCHIHTPLGVSAMRIVLGLGIGAAFGAAIWAAARRRLRVSA